METYLIHGALSLAVSGYSWLLIHRFWRLGDGRSIGLVACLVPFANIVYAIMSTVFFLHNFFSIPRYVRKTVALMLKRGDFAKTHTGINNRALHVDITGDTLVFSGKEFKTTLYLHFLRNNCEGYRDKFKQTYDMYKQSKKQGA